MDAVTVSPKYQVVIPKSIREIPGFEPGKQLIWIAKGHSVKLVPVLPLEELREIFKGIDTSNIREKVDRF